MSKFTDELINNISPYVPGEQPKGRSYIKLNTNENPYYTSRSAIKKINKKALENLNRYSDPESVYLTRAIADYYGVGEKNVLVTNGSDEALAFAFYCFCRSGVCYPDVTYGFYDVIANLFECKSEKIALNSDFEIETSDYLKKGNTVVIANPNAQTGIELAKEKLIEIIEANPDNVVIVDQAYADFGTYNAVELTKKYKNLLTVNTFSKSRSLAGARVGFAIGDSSLIEDLKKVKNSFHPYNVNSISGALAASAISDKAYFEKTVALIKQEREKLTLRLREIGFTVLPSSSNFVLAKCDKIDGETLYLKLKEKGVLVRHFTDERIKNFIRITVGNAKADKILIEKIEEILKEC